MNALCKLSQLIVAATTVALSGCGANDDARNLNDTDLALSTAASDTAAAHVLVREYEFNVAPARRSVMAGPVEFQVLNTGTEEHEFVVVKTDLSIDQLPTNPDGSFDEEGDGVEVVDEIEGVEPGTMERLDVSLDAGHYVLMCNRVEVEEDGEVESHFAMGMRADFNVR